MKVKVTGPSRYETEENGNVVIHYVFSPPPAEAYEGMEWNGVMGRYVSENEAEAIRTKGVEWDTENRVILSEAEDKLTEYQCLMKEKYPNIDAKKVLQDLIGIGKPEEVAEEFRLILGSGKIDDKSNKSRNSGRKPRSSIVKMAMGQDSAEHRMVEFRELMAKKFPDKDATVIISELGKMDSAEEQEAYIRSLFDGK